MFHLDAKPDGSSNLALEEKMGVYFIHHTSEGMRCLAQQSFAYVAKQEWEGF